MARRAPVQVFKVPSVIGPRWIGQCVMCGWARGSGHWPTAFRVAQAHAATHAPRCLAKAEAAPGSLRPWPFSTRPDHLALAR